MYGKISITGKRKINILEGLNMELTKQEIQSRIEKISKLKETEQDIQKLKIINQAVKDLSSLL
jgi:hypothetical protein